MQCAVRFPTCSTLAEVGRNSRSVSPHCMLRSPASWIKRCLDRFGGSHTLELVVPADRGAYPRWHERRSRTHDGCGLAPRQSQDRVGAPEIDRENDPIELSRAGSAATGTSPKRMAWAKSGPRTKAIVAATAAACPCPIGGVEADISGGLSDCLRLQKHRGRSLGLPSFVRGVSELERAGHSWDPRKAGAPQDGKEHAECEGRGVVNGVSPRPHPTPMG